MRKPGFETRCAHAGEDPARYERAVSPPIFQSSIFGSADSGSFMAWDSDHPPYFYTRIANPTTDILEAKLASLEGSGAARCFASGMAAISASILHCIRTGDHIVAVRTIYGPTRQFLSNYLDRFGIEVTYVTGVDPCEFEDATRPNTRLYYLESPSTWVFDLQDLGAISTIARSHGIITVIDNSWASPYFQNPVDFGIDLVVHSATKYLAGHSDIVAGAAMGSKERILQIQDQEASLLGAALDPFASWLMMRGVRTLPVRLNQHQSNAMAVAQWLEAHPRVARVYYPGLPSHPQYELGRKQMRGYSGLLSFALKSGGREAACAVVDRLRYFTIACSWGGYESLATPIPFPASNDAPGLYGLRLHVGLESVEDLLEDLDEALKETA